MEREALELLVEAIRNLQAGQIAQARVLRAIIASHPLPLALQDAWREYAAPSIADVELSKIADPSRRAIHDALALALSDWDAYLARDSARGASPSG